MKVWNRPLALVYVLLALAWGLALALVAPWWATAPRGWEGLRRLALPAGFAALLMNLVVLWFLPAASLGPLPWVLGLLGAMAAYAAQGLGFLLASGAARRRWLSTLCAGGAAGSQLAFTGLSAWLLAGEFAGRYAPFGIGSPLSRPLLALLLTLGSGSAGLLLAAGLAAAGEALHHEEVLLHEEVDTTGRSERDLIWAARLRRVAGWLAGALLLRLGVVAGALYLAATRSPISVGHYLTISLAPSSSFILVRAMIGLALPLLYALLVRHTARTALPAEAARQLVPAVLMIVLTEIIAAALTVGNWGVPF